MNNPDQKLNSNENKPTFEVKIEFDDNIILLSAICTNEIPYNQLVADIFADQKQLTLSKSFNNLTTKDKLLVIKSAMYTHFNLMKGEIPGYGQIQGYQLIYNSNIFLFDLRGKLISNNVFV
jgi:hypothetical protein